MTVTKIQNRVQLGQNWISFLYLLNVLKYLLQLPKPDFVMFINSLRLQDISCRGLLHPRCYWTRHRHWPPWAFNWERTWPCSEQLRTPWGPECRKRRFTSNWISFMNSPLEQLSNFFFLRSLCCSSSPTGLVPVCWHPLVAVAPSLLVRLHLTRINLQWWELLLWGIIIKQRGGNGNFSFFFGTFLL